MYRLFARPQLGKKVALVEKRSVLGGTCLNIGCIPSKVLLDSTEFYSKSSHEAASHGIIFRDLRFDLRTMMKRKKEVVSKLTSGLSGIIQHNSISLFQGRATLTEQSEVQIQNHQKSETIQAGHIIVATGSVPQELPSLPFDGQTIVSSTEALEFNEVPPRMLVVGGGAIGLELGSVWLRLGSQVTVCELQEQILPSGDQQVSRTLRRLLEMQGMRFALSTSLKGVVRRADALEVTLQGATQEPQKFMVDVVLVAVGRRPYTEGLGLNRLNKDKL